AAEVERGRARRQRSATGGHRSQSATGVAARGAERGAERTGGRARGALQRRRHAPGRPTGPSAGSLGRSCPLRPPRLGGERNLPPAAVRCIRGWRICRSTRITGWQPAPRRGYAGWILLLIVGGEDRERSPLP